MDIDKEKQALEFQQPAEKEAATGSGGLFGDLAHDKPGTSVDQVTAGLASQPVHDGTPSTHLTAVQQATVTKPQFHQGATYVAAEAEAGQSQEQQQESLAGKSTVAGVQSHPQQQVPQQQISPPIGPPSIGTESSHQPVLQEHTAVLDHQPSAFASSSDQATQALDLDDNAADPDQLPPIQEAQLAEEQDLVPDVRSSNRIERPQRRRRLRAQDQLTHKYVASRRRSTTPTLPLAATRQYSLHPRSLLFFER